MVLDRLVLAVLLELSARLRRREVPRWDLRATFLSCCLERFCRLSSLSPCHSVLPLYCSRDRRALPERLLAARWALVRGSLPSLVPFLASILVCTYFSTQALRPLLVSRVTVRQESSVFQGAFQLTSR